MNKRLDAVRGAYEAFLEWLVFVLMAVMACEVTLGVIYRSLGASLVWYDEVASILLAWLTFYGAALANLFCLPIADKLHLKLVDEEVNRTLIIDGILMIREAKSPTLVREMLLAYLPEKHRHSDSDDEDEDKEAEAVAA